MVTDTIILSQEGKDDMLPYMERVTNMLPEVMDRIHARMTREEIYAQMEYDRKQVFRCYLGFYNPFPRTVLDKKYWLHYDIADDVAF